ncbi:DNA-binding protein [Rhizobium phaseoli]|uniref:DNA-binding protein n=1 Tax=Rhizobium phaseoli TaxID=396 RepID=UPI0003176A44|nr:DNA-binding protein [Rhizobium phaseoli]KKZ83562.1 hypothetical protein RPHASCH2410_PD01355 [Rhizobium phaseoli Ch24-10]RDJ03344.1 DNA-binding protein [Rhizobium phaseoli]RDJ05290.1 DNA-binding protein [Rhizobium phaseoli]
MDHVSKNFEAAKALRATKGYSFEELAITTGLTTAEIAATERGDDVPAHNREKIEQALK